MVKFLLWCILLAFCWPLALLALVVYPFVWLALLPFRLMGIAAGGVLVLVWALVTLPARLLPDCDDELPDTSILEQCHC